MAPEDASSYTIKEMISLLILPALDELKDLVAEKANAAEVESVSARVTLLERTALTPEKVETQFSDLFQSAKARGWKTWERVAGVALAVTSLTGFFLSTMVAIKTLTG